MKKMKTFFIVLVLFAFQFDHSQNFNGYAFQLKQKPKNQLILDKDYFLLGTLLDYMGRDKTYKNPDIVDNYYKGENSLMAYIMKIYNDDSPEVIIEKNPYSSDRDILKSKKVAEKINSFYDFNNKGGFMMDSSFSGLNAKEFRKKTDDFHKSTELKDTVYNGTMKTNLFKTNLQKISFIIGAYARFGEPNEMRYCIRMFNSTRKYDYCLAILKELKCKNIEKKIIHNIPTNQIIYFKPSRELKKYLDEYKILRLR